MLPSSLRRSSFEMGRTRSSTSASLVARSSSFAKLRAVAACSSRSGTWTTITGNTLVPTVDGIKLRSKTPRLISKADVDRLARVRLLGSGGRHMKLANTTPAPQSHRSVLSELRERRPLPAPHMSKYRTRTHVLRDLDPHRERERDLPNTLFHGLYRLARRTQGSHQGAVARQQGRKAVAEGQRPPSSAG
jgi:hypothetical protein